MKKPFHRLSISSILALILLLLSVTVAFAAPPLGFHMEVDEIINGTGESFYASGPGVDAGVVCPTGTTSDLVVNIFGPSNGNYQYLYITKSFTCDNGTGTFFIKMRVKLDLTTGFTSAKWQFTNGSGDYNHLRGHGTLVGTPIIPFVEIQDVYDGVAH
jgi:hypothetical protein